MTPIFGTIFAVSLRVDGAMPPKIFSAHCTGYRIAPVIPIVGLTFHCISNPAKSGTPQSTSFVNNMVGTSTGNLSNFSLSSEYLFLKEQPTGLHSLLFRCHNGFLLTWYICGMLIS